jgi:hypothetical protein
MVLYTDRLNNSLKKLLRLISQWCLLVMMILCVGCQSELIEVEEPPMEEVLKMGGNTLATVLHMLQMDGSYDNILDRSSCTSVQLPVTVLVNGEELIIETKSDLVKINQLFELSEEDEDTLDLVLPFILIFPDYTNTLLTSSNDFVAITSDCLNGEDEDIECIDFIYPIELNVYNTNTQLASVLTFNDDESLFLHLERLDDERITAFKFPVELEQDDLRIQIFNNDELVSIIENADGTCDEEDEVETIEEKQINELLISGAWEITLFEDGEDKTDNFSGYTFLFKLDDILIAEINEIQTEGSWEFDAEESEDVLDLEFDTEEEPLSLLNASEWKMISSSDTTLSLIGGEDDEPKKLFNLKKR